MTEIVETGIAVEGLERQRLLQTEVVVVRGMGTRKPSTDDQMVLSEWLAYTRENVIPRLSGACEFHWVARQLIRALAQRAG
jgi:hypothetical protein